MIQFREENFKSTKSIVLSGPDCEIEDNYKYYCDSSPEKEHNRRSMENCYNM